MRSYKIYKDEKNHLGLISEDGDHKTPAVYDEIQQKEGNYWYCRAYTNWDYFYPSSGTFSICERNGIITGANGNSVDCNSGPTSIKDREVYDSIPERKTEQFIFTYVNGKFGLKDLDGTVILEAIYDELNVWENADVIHVRVGDSHFYFNKKKERILFDVPEYNGDDEDKEPYYEDMGWDDMIIREIVDQVSDNHTFASKVGLIRIDRKDVKDVARILEAHCERIPMNPEAIKLLTDQYSYEFGMTIIRIHADTNGVICDDEWTSGIEKLNVLGAFGNSWYYIDKFVTNSNTMLSTKGLFWLKQWYEMKCAVLGDLCFAYGIDESLQDGEVKWIHVEHYNEHCFPEDYGVCETMRYGTLSDLKNLIESHDWDAQGDPYGGCFFGYRNIRYPEERTWEETEKILNYMYDLGQKPEDLVKAAISNLGFLCNTIEEISFWEKCLEWAFDRCEFPNNIYDGKTCYDEYLRNRLNIRTEDVQDRINNLDELFLSHGAKTSIWQLELDKKKINEVADPYDYSIIKRW